MTATKQPTLFTNQTVLLAEWDSLLHILYLHPGQFRKWLKHCTVPRPRPIWRCTGCGSNFTNYSRYPAKCVYCGALPDSENSIKLNDYGRIVHLFPLVVEQLHLDRYWIIESRKPKFTQTV